MKSTVAIIIVVLLLLFSNCMLLFQSTSLNPPRWIRGTWYDYYGDYRIDFTYDNVIVTINGAETDYKYYIEDAVSNGESPDVSESSTSSSYSFTIIWDGGFVDANKFELSDSEILWWTIEGIAGGVELQKYD